MDFSTLTFLFIFLPLFLSLYLVATPTLRLYLVLFASIAFLVAGQWVAIFWLTGIGLIGYGFGRLIENGKAQGKNISKWLWLGIGINVGLLITFKWLISYGNDLSIGEFQLSSIIVPLGLSYITFQSISYLIDVSRGTLTAEQNLVKYLTYILFFPKLVSGPIVRYKQFGSQLDVLSPSVNDIAAGLRRILLGIVKRVLIANQLGSVANAVFNLPMPNIEPHFAWLALIAYTLQIYFDFSGYTDIALGLGKVIGINLAENFNYPYTAQSISDFWRRWHITLSTWFREYVFYPLERRRFKWAGQQINLLIIFLLTGLWHGFKPTFIIWGLLHGIALVIESLSFGRWLKQVWRPVRHVYTLTIILIGWVFFRSDSLRFAYWFFRRLLGDTTGLTPLPFSLTTPFPFIEPSFIVILIVGILFALPLSPILNQIRTSFEKGKENLFLLFQVSEDIAIILLYILAIAMLLSNGFTPNLYAKF